VRHPGVSEAIERDFETMVWVAHVATQLFPSIRSLRLEDTLKQFAAPLHEQVGVAQHSISHAVAAHRIALYCAVLHGMG
jgi:hypothetical protein